jgi:hypothetical protein
MSDKTGDDDTRATRVWTAVATAIINHITANAVVLPSGTPKMVVGSSDVTGQGRIT